MPSYSRKVRIPGKSSQELYDCVSQEIEQFLDKSNIKGCQLSRDPGLKEIQVKSSFFSAKLKCAEDEMVLDADLSWMALPFKSKLDESISRWLTKTFNLS